jgi:TonB family protein
MRRYRVTFVAFCLGLVIFSRFSALAQDQPEAGRKILAKATPAYPELARKMHLFGTVKLEAVVSPDGKVKSTRLLGGHPLLTQAAVDAIGRWRWAPAAGETTELVEFHFHE